MIWFTSVPVEGQRMLAVGGMTKHHHRVTELKTGPLLRQLEQAILSGLQHDVPTQLLYHYTAGNVGLKGILQTKKIWATQFEHMNDPEELVIGDRLVRDVAEELCNEPGQNNWQQLIRRQFLKHQADMAVSKLMRQICIASFSELADGLVQWREYGGYGAGYALGFRFHRSDENGTEVSYLGAVFKQMKYDPVATKAHMKERLTDAFAALERFARPRWNHMRGDQQGRVMNGGMALCHHRAGVMALPVKHEAYAVEREWRAVVMPRHKAPERVMKIRLDAANNEVPYVELPLVLNPDDLIRLEEVRVGFGSDQAERAEYASALVQSLGYSPDIVKLSTVPMVPPPAKRLPRV
jgi:DUF2971 family protein